MDIKSVRPKKYTLEIHKKKNFIHFILFSYRKIGEKTGPKKRWVCAVDEISGMYDRRKKMVLDSVGKWL